MPKKPVRVEREPTHYLNVDLDIFASAPLDDLVRAMGERVFVLHVGGQRRKYEAHLELASSHMRMSADKTIVGLIDLVQRLPPRFRKVWDSAKAREFNVGIEAGVEPHAFELRLQPRTVDALSRVRGALVFTVYARDLSVAGAGPSDGTPPRVPPKPGRRGEAESR